uniref:G protein-coupled receptor n=1 Tax=Panagrolaimus davidi TaxID=227884 RepID=A0A914PN02_9BILA
MDIHLTVIYGMYRLFPANILSHENVSLSGGSVFIGFAYQYHSFTDDVNLLHTKRGIFGSFLTCILIPIPLIALYIPCVDYEANKIDVLHNYPQFYEFFITNACNSAIVNKNLIIYMSALVITLIFAFFVGLCFAWKIKKKLTENQNIMSAANLKLRKQYFFVLIVQMSIPLVFIVIPLTIISIFVFFNVGDSTATFLW